MPETFAETLARHERIALSFSGGKDSLACVYLLRPFLDRITVYHLDTGDLLPEVHAVVAHVKAMAPHFVLVRTDAHAWMAAHGLPTDLLPHSSHVIGQAMGEGVRLVGRYDCCYANLMLPLFQRIRDDGNTLLIRGTKRVDMPRLPKANGDSGDGVEIMLPIQDWSHQQVFDYLREQGAPINPIYDHVTNSPECASCPAWWSERRAAYLRDRHPQRFALYRERMRVVMSQLDAPLIALAREVKELGI